RQRGQDPPHHIVETLGRDLRRRLRRRDADYAELEVVRAGVGRRERVAHGDQRVCTDEAGKAEVALQGAEDRRVLAGVSAVHLRVRTHHRHRAAVAQGRGEGGEIDLPERAIGDDDVYRGREPVEQVAVTLDLLVVRRVVLHLCDDVPALETAHLGRGDLPGEERVLAQRLRGASPERRAEGGGGRAEE